jgi:hypothetical protein
MFAVGDGLPPADEDDDEAQAASASSAAASDTFENGVEDTGFTGVTGEGE